MRADNRGEGGILALTALVSSGLERQTRGRWWLVGFGSWLTSSRNLTAAS